MGRIKTGAVQVDGLVELNRALKVMDRDLAKDLRAASKAVATFVSNDARAAAQSIGGVAAHVAPSIKASAGATSAGVAFGGPAYPMAGGAEFGAYQYPQFQPWRGNGPGAGYFVYPAIRQDVDRIETEYHNALEHLIAKAGLK
jgi:hypothetical protein